MLIDIHAHMKKYPDPISYDEKNDTCELILPTGEELIKLHDKLGIDRAVILPIVSSEVYVPQSVGEVIEFCNGSNGRFIPFCNLDPRVISNTSDADLGFLMDFYKRQGCKCMGEVLPNMEFLDPKMQNLFYHCEKTGWPLIFDLSGKKGYHYGLYDDAGLPQLEKCLEKFPDLIFVGHGPSFWAEIEKIDKVENRKSYLKTPIKEEGAIARLMRTYPNLWLDLSAGSGYYAMTRDIEYSKAFLNEFADRTMFGSDICFAKGSKTLLIDFLKGLHKDGALSDEKYEAITHKNAERLLGI